MLQDIQEAHAGQIVAVFGVDCASGQSFTCQVTDVLFLYWFSS
jgi:translation elongation factor EF-G